MLLLDKTRRYGMARTLEDVRQSREILFAIVVLLSLLVIGTAGYGFIEGWSLLDSLYMTVITLSTVGFMEVHELS